MSFVATIDPGLDGAAVALWSVTDVLRFGTLSTERRMAALVRWQLFKTNPQDEMPVRLDHLYLWARSVAYESPAKVAYVERPAFAGTYASRAARQRGKQALNAKSMAGFHMALGAIVVGLQSGGAHVELVPPITMPKAERFQVLAAVWKGARPDEPMPANADVRDALCLGLVAPPL